MKLSEVKCITDIAQYCYEKDDCIHCEICNKCYINEQLMLGAKERLEEIQKFNRKEKLKKLLNHD